ncbi:DNA recombination protein RmuC [Candidatus Pacearchaeota archaeon]|jgi:DNA recombination protein RmuC|nr:DNA recombination protein RmuC [Candidatus Pacearchaeota archaeon]HCX45255.1 DNA recombination protein RmuC [Patescibacteria group bacterium]|tara:strand:- start:168 stop:1226 length:1059 start_codon:yes stop_codon:yes gene_type:complete
MNIAFLLVVLIAITLGFVALFWFLNKKLSPENKSDDKSLLLLQNQMNEINRTLDSHFKESSRMLQKQFGSSATIIKDVTERLTKLDETNKQVVGFADQLKSLQDVLKNPKQRGVLGEYYLETLLKNIFPPGVYQMQYSFKDGSIVDAAIFYQDKIVPVDSKFSLENYNRILEARTNDEREKLEKAFSQDLKLRIEETSKYVKPEENTTDFAFMFIPAEAIYYDLLINQVGAVKSNTRDLIEYAYRDKKVIIVSPTSFMAYLQTVMQGMKTQQIEQSAKEIIKRVQVLGRHLSAYEKYMQKMGNHLGTTVNTYNSAYKELGKIDKDVLKIGGKAIGTKTEVLDKPKQEEGTLI